jgi:signal transduction histidine kinase
LMVDRTRNKKEIICIGNDITKIKKAEIILREMDKRKSAFVAHVAHEFKNPLAVIRESLAYILDGSAGKVDPGQKELLEMGKRNIERLIRLVTDLLDISKIEAGKMELKKVKVSIGSLVKEVVTVYRAEMAKKNISFRMSAKKDTGSILADKDKLTEVVINLLSNAIKYTPIKGCISVKLSGDAKEVRFEIQDTGPGIAIVNQEKIFDKFERIVVRNEEGTGLGLSISRDIIGLHKGKLWVESMHGNGSKFVFTIPRK